MLHPTLGEEYLPKPRKNLPPGFMTLNSIFSDDVETKRTKKLKMGQNKPHSSYNYFQKLPPSNFDVPVITNASPYDNGEEERYRKEQVMKKKSWVSSQNFKLFFGKASAGKSDNFIPNYVTITPSNPPLLHKFRKENRKKWVGGK